MLFPPPPASPGQPCSWAPCAAQAAQQQEHACGTHAEHALGLLKVARAGGAGQRARSKLRHGLCCRRRGAARRCARRRLGRRASGGVCEWVRV